MAPSAPSYLLLGQLRRDYLITPEQKVLEDQPGGNLLYAVQGARLWLEGDERIGLVARVGEDYPRAWLEDFIERGYLIDGVKVLPEEIDLRRFRAYTNLRTVEMDDPVAHFSRLGLTMPRALLGIKRSEKNEFSKVATSLSLRQADIPDSYQEARAAHICSMDFVSQSLMPAALRQAGIQTVTLDPGRYLSKDHWEEIKAVVIGLTAFLPSEDELIELFTGRSGDMIEMMEEVASWGVNVVVVKRAWKGQLLYDSAAKRCYEIPAYPSKMSDPVGAGDVFAGGFLVGLERTSDPLQAVMYGNVAASIAVEGSGVFYTQAVLPGLQQARLESIRESYREI